MFPKVLRLTIALAFTMVSGAVAAVVFDNFAAGDLYDPSNYSAVTFYPWADPPGYGIDTDVALAFSTSGSAYSFLEVTVALSLIEGSNKVEISLRTDLGGVPDTALETWSLNGLMAAYPGVYTPITVTSTINPILSPGETYWIVVSAPGPGLGRLAWHINVTGYVGLGAFRNMFVGVGSWVSANAYQNTMRVIGRRLSVSNEQTTWSQTKALFR